MKNLHTLAACVAIAVAAPAMAFAGPRYPGADSGPPGDAFCSQDDAEAALFRSGDRITVTVYERIDPDPNDRLPSDRRTFPSYRLRAEVSGDFRIADDGSISVPIIGQLTAAGKSVQQLTDAIGKAFESSLGHVGMISIAVAEHQPIYVDGVVKSPGAYKYTSGLTVAHALSLAGGFEDIKLESHQILVQTMQELGTGEQAKQTLERLLARQAVLLAEYEGSPASVPQSLVDLAGETRAKALIAAQVSERNSVVEANDIQEQGQTRMVDSARQALELRQSQIKYVEQAIEQRTARMDTLKSMVSKGLLSGPLYQDAQAQYLDNLSKREDVTLGIQQTQQQLVDAQANLVRLKLEARHALQHEIADLELQIANQWIVYRSHLTTMNILNADPDASPGAAPLAYEIVRRVGSSAATYRVKPSCLLQPGDLIKVFLPIGKEPNDTVSEK
ncbi:SLBB domain-containing protein [Roseiarcus fermentans]|uniref:SLBB domain-containing protein n=1 Tax=Roseiarcus fermentans TaxID=1473586 RepID=A0A366EXK2_9HYPH|nr:polysaccharide biosynthesis/export family protein [Roseiarcus fermentans]RBP07117.1 SLBB domain-containing protein [Roseiarcus fermentans]